MPSGAKTRIEPASVKQRLLDTADRLFYADGIRAVGIDRVLAEADSAKASLYRHFGSKEGLVAACVERRVEKGRAQMEDFMKDVPPAGRALKIFDWIVAWAESSDFRGCPLQHVVSEIPNPEHPARKIASGYREWVREQFVRSLRAASVRDPARRAGALLVLYDGAFAASEQDGPQRARDARRIAKQLLQPHDVKTGVDE
jgi:AcrR family transcriptional regulator